eukprot:2776272-Prymnesium_polylepis.1
MQRAHDGAASLTDVASSPRRCLGTRCGTCQASHLCVLAAQLHQFTTVLSHYSPNTRAGNDVITLLVVEQHTRVTRVASSRCALTDGLRGRGRHAATTRVRRERGPTREHAKPVLCLLYTSDAADDM